MHIEHTSSGDLLELTVRGVLDNESSIHLSSAIDEHVRDGWHRILVHLQHVNYLSSAGINALLTSKKRLEQLHGQFGITSPTAEVERVLVQTRLLELLHWDAEQARAQQTGGEFTRSLASRIAREDGLDLIIYELEREASSTCRVLGDPQPLFESTFTQQQCMSVKFSKASMGIGLGALGDDFPAASARFGELLAVAGALTQSAPSRRQVPDYSLAQGEYVPQAQILYGITCEGGYSQLIRFQSAEPGAPVEFSRVVRQCLQQTRLTQAVVVLLVETAGLLGAHLRRSPAGPEATALQRFEFPEVRDWVSFSPERVYARNLALIVGVARTCDANGAPTALDALLRPLDRTGELAGHFHAAVFPYQALKKRTLDLHACVQEQFAAGGILDVLHLLRDDRPTIGVGESELVSGACWVSPIDRITAAEATR